MILQALTNLYEALAEKGLVALDGWSKEQIGYALCINRDGILEEVIPCIEQEQKGNKTDITAKKMIVPARVKRTSAFASNFMWDKSAYLLGSDEEDQKSESVSAKNLARFETAKKLHHELLDGVDSEAAKAVLNFFDSWDPAIARENEKIAPYAKEIFSKANITFRFRGDFAINDPEIKSAWQRHCSSDEGKIGRCLVTGEKEVIQPIHSSIKNVQGAQSSGAALVSFNAPAYCSYNKEQNLNAPVGKYAAFAYTTALNYLLSDRKEVVRLGENFIKNTIDLKKGRRKKHRIGDATVVCWAEGADERYEDFAEDILFGSEDETVSTAEYGAAVRETVKKLAAGQYSEKFDLDPDKKFYILGIAPNSARLAIRFFYCDAYGTLMKNVNAHNERTKIILPAYCKYSTLSLWRLLNATVNLNSKDKTPSPVMAGAVARSIFTGGRYPAALIENVFMRIRAERAVTPERAAIIKAYYLKNENHMCPKEVLTVSLNESSTNVPYVLGRLFSVYEEIQAAAATNPDMTTTIKDKYFNSAAAMPATVFPILNALAQKHLRKLAANRRISLDKKLTELKGLLGENYPLRMTLAEQGSFDLGYYHQTQKRYTKKEEK